MVNIPNNGPQSHGEKSKITVEILTDPEVQRILTIKGAVGGQTALCFSHSKMRDRHANRRETNRQKKNRKQFDEGEEYQDE